MNNLDEYILPATEFYESNKDGFTHFVTLTLSPLLAKQRINRQYMALIGNLKNFPPLYNYLGTFFRRWISVFEITKKGVIHIHLLGEYHSPEMDIILKDSLKNNSTFGNIHDIRPCYNVDNCWLYMCKDIDKTFKCINSMTKSGGCAKEVFHYCENEISFMDCRNYRKNIMQHKASISTAQSTVKKLNIITLDDFVDELNEYNYGAFHR